MKSLTLKEHLAKHRSKAHETQRKNGHYKLMATKSVEKRRAKVSQIKETI